MNKNEYLNWRRSISSYDEFVTYAIMFKHLRDILIDGIDYTLLKEANEIINLPLYLYRHFSSSFLKQY